MRTADFDYALPPELIAQQPAQERDQSRLLVLHRNTGQVEHRRFNDLPEFLRKGDVLVLNNSRVIPARLRGVNARTGGTFEMLLLEENVSNDWWAMMKPGKRARVGTRIEVRPPPSPGPASIIATVLATNPEGHRRLRFEGTRNILDTLDEVGEVPLPPYITRPGARPSGTQHAAGGSASKICSVRWHHHPLRPGGPHAGAPARADTGSDAASDAAERRLDRERYQTVYAQSPGSVAAPTAGLHFTEPLLDQLQQHGVEVHFVTLHVGLGTFAPVKSETLAAHVMHEERFELNELTTQAVNRAKAEGRRVIAVGTTTLRVLESVAAQNGVPLTTGRGRTRIFIHPPYEFKIVDALLTNFHLPRSTLLMLVSAFATPGRTRGRDLVLAAYAEAIRKRYRFFSYGDAMLLL